MKFSLRFLIFTMLMLQVLLAVIVNCEWHFYSGKNWPRWAIYCNSPIGPHCISVQRYDYPGNDCVCLLWWSEEPEMRCWPAGWIWEESGLRYQKSSAEVETENAAVEEKKKRQPVRKLGQWIAGGFENARQQIRNWNQAATLWGTLCAWAPVMIVILFLAALYRLMIRAPPAKELPFSVPKDLEPKARNDKPVPPSSAPDRGDFHF